jgi:ribonucleotide reductase alpha subunit
MDKSLGVLSDITVFSKYARHLPDKQRRESWEEIVWRSVSMHTKKFPHLESEIIDAHRYVLDKKVLPSMRSAQFAGPAIELNNSRMFNCAYLPMSEIEAFQEVMFLLLGGTGVGYSVQQHHVSQLPPIIGQSNKTKKYVIGDSIIGWSDAVKTLVNSYFKGKPIPDFDFSDIRPKGSLLITAGGKAPGPGPLKTCLYNINRVFESAMEERGRGTSLKPIEVHDINCFIADAVLSGGIRRAACIALFSYQDKEMLECKFGNWWETNPQRARANNSVVMVRSKANKKHFDWIWERVKASGSGEPGIYWTNDKDVGTNPCCFDGEQRLLTASGYKRFVDLSKEYDCDLVNERGEIVNGRVWCSGVKKTVLVKTSTKNYKCTPEHRFKLNDGSECEAKDLKGKRIKQYHTEASHFNEIAYAGFVYGDGNLNRLKSKFHKGIEINIGDKDKEIGKLMGLEVIDGKRSYYTRKFVDYLNSIGPSIESMPSRTFPSKLPASHVNSFLCGLFSANGGVITNHRISFKTSCKDMAYRLKGILELLKINSYITTNKSKEIKFSNGIYTCKESYDVNISGIKDIVLFAEKINFLHEYKRHALRDLIITKSPYVKAVKDSNEVPVYDFELDDDTHWGVVDGVVVHNCEVSLKPYQFCNLTTINGSDIETQDELNRRAAAASFIGTLQASYTDFHYLRDVWKETTEEDALVGVSITGIGSGKLESLDLKMASNIAVGVNEITATKIKINLAKRVTTIKPEGSGSLVVGSSSGIHAWYAPYYIRRMRFNKDESIYGYLKHSIPHLVEDDFFKPETQAVVSIPVKAPEGAIFRNESALSLLERTKRFHSDWIKIGHKDGINTNNVSVTVSIKDDEWESAGDWMWENRNNYNGIAVLPYDGGSYKQAPFEEITEEQYDELIKHVRNIDLTKVKEEVDNTNLKGEIACSGGACEI